MSFDVRYIFRQFSEVVHFLLDLQNISYIDILYEIWDFFLHFFFSPPWKPFQLSRRKYVDSLTLNIKGTDQLD